MLKFLYKINKKYEQIKEPNRFFIFLAIAMPGIILSSGDFGVPVSFGGMAYLLILLAGRMIYMHKWFKPSE